MPVYNKESRIKNCLNSIIKQTYLNFELIIIDDGSSDGSERILEEFKDKDLRISVFRQKNQGVSVARNKGIEIAKGDYISFVDADDTLEPCFLENLVANIDGDEDIISETKNKSRVYHDKEIAEYIDTEGRTVEGTVVWGKLYKASIIKDNNLHFVPGLRWGEDSEFNLSLWPLCKTIKIINSSYYNFYKEEGKIWSLTPYEINNKIIVLKEKYANINQYFNSQISCETDINITLSLYSLEELLKNEKDYIKLYTQVYPTSTTTTLYNDFRCSPLIKGITISKKLIAKNPNISKKLLKTLSQKYNKLYFQIKIPYRSHKIIAFLLGSGLPNIAFIVLKIFYYLKK